MLKKVYQLLGWGVFLLMAVVACRPETISVTIIPLTRTPVAEETPPAYTPSATASPSQTPVPTASEFSGLIPTYLPETGTPSAQNTTSLEDYREHIVQRGENLTLIANRYHLTVDTLLLVNDRARWQVLYAGEVLRIPMHNVTPTLSPTPDIDALILDIQAELVSFRVSAIPGEVNELSYDDFLVMPDAVIDNIRVIYARGQELGRNPRAFTRIGDSTIEAPHFFYRFEDGEYHLGDYIYLERTINYYEGSFAHNSIAVIRGLHSWSVFDPMWSPGLCDPGEHMLACEFRLHNPAIIFIRLGTNDRGQPDATRENFEEIVSYCIDNGVIPILGTKADRFDGEDNAVNTIIREIAEAYHVPLWDFDRVADTLLGHGLGRDNVHLTVFYDHDWRLGYGFTTGHGVHNLTGLIVLDEIRQVLNDE